MNEDGTAGAKHGSHLLARRGPAGRKARKRTADHLRSHREHTPSYQMARPPPGSFCSHGRSQVSQRSIRPCAGSLPLARRVVAGLRRWAAPGRFTSARAESTVRRPVGHAHIPDHLRLHSEHRRSPAARSMRRGLPPLARSPQRRQRDGGGPPGVTWRSRGAHERVLRLSWVIAGSPPLAQRARPDRQRLRHRPRITSARAESSVSPECPGCARPAHLRSGGVRDEGADLGADGWGTSARAESRARRSIAVPMGTGSPPLAQRADRLCEFAQWECRNTSDRAENRTSPQFRHGQLRITSAREESSQRRTFWWTAATVRLRWRGEQGGDLVDGWLRSGSPSHVQRAIVGSEHSLHELGFTSTSAERARVWRPRTDRLRSRGEDSAGAHGGMHGNGAPPLARRVGGARPGKSDGPVPLCSRGGKRAR